MLNLLWDCSQKCAVPYILCHVNCKLKKAAIFSSVCLRGVCFRKGYSFFLHYPGPYLVRIFFMSIILSVPKSEYLKDFFSPHMQTCLIVLLQESVLLSSIVLHRPYLSQEMFFDLKRLMWWSWHSLQCAFCRHFNNAFFARVGGVSVVELNRLELEFLFRLDFQLSVTISVFESYCSHLEKEVRTLGKKSQRIEQSLPAFGSPSTTEAAEMTSFWKKRVAAAVHKSRLNSSQLAAQYEQSIAKMISRQSSFQSL